MANQLLVKGGGDRKSKLTSCCAVSQSINKLFLNPDLNDVCFLVGDKKEKFIAHRFILALESEVFKSMFTGEMKETKYEIEVPDLSPVGFRNMLKYFYTKKVEEIDLSEIYPTYMAANKYLVLSLIEDLTDHITKNSLDVSNSCLIYDQLVKLAISDSFTGDVKLRIAKEFTAACASDSFKQIDKDTLVSILKFNQLNIAELDLLKVCIGWTDCEVVRQGLDANQANKRATFEPIKHLIRFADLSLSEFASIREINNYLTKEEVSDIFHHLGHQIEPIQIDYLSPRGSYKTQVAKGIKSEDLSSSSLSLTSDISVCVDKTVQITSIKTFPISNCASLRVEVYRNNQWTSSGCKTVADQNGSYTIDLAHLLEANCKYQLRFSFKITSYDSDSFGDDLYFCNFGISREMSLSSKEGGVMFKIKTAKNYHCIESINFCCPFD